MADLHTEADLGEGSAPVGRQLGLSLIKPSLPSCKVVCISIAPEMGVVVKSSLRVYHKRVKKKHFTLNGSL